MMAWLVILLLAAAPLRPALAASLPGLDAAAWAPSAAWYDEPVTEDLLSDPAALLAVVGMGVEPVALLDSSRLDAGVFADRAEGAVVPLLIGSLWPEDHWTAPGEALAASTGVRPADTFARRAAQAVHEFGRPPPDDTADFILSQLQDPNLTAWQVMGLADVLLTPVGLRKMLFSGYCLALVVVIVAVAACRELVSRPRHVRHRPRLYQSASRRPGRSAAGAERDSVRKKVWFNPFNRQLPTTPVAMRALRDD